LTILIAAVIVATQKASAQFLPKALDATPITLPYSQDWSSALSLLTVDNDWSQMTGMEGYLGQKLTSTAGVDPQTITGVSTKANDRDLIANQLYPDSLLNGGCAEFEIADPVVALQPSNAADAPYLLITLSTIDRIDLNISYVLRDLDGSIDNAVQPFALQYRIGTTSAFTNIPAGYVADATTGPSEATQRTPVFAQLPIDAENRPVVQIRIITTNAVGNDEWVGIDDIVIGAVALPVQLTSFTAVAESNGAFLRWSTATETNCAGFEVERRQLAVGDWQRIGIVAGAGNSVAPREYTYVDNTVTPGRFVYRLKQLDNDGRFEYFGNAEVEVGIAPKEFFLADNFPNPFNPATTIRFSLREDAEVTLRVYDFLGREVALLFDGWAKAGRYYDVRFDGTSLSSGFYSYWLQTGSDHAVKRMLFLK